MKRVVEHQGEQIEEVRAERMIRRILNEESKYIKSKNKPTRQKIIGSLCSIIEEEEKCF